jgi:hypothetical protein
MASPWKQNSGDGKGKMGDYKIPPAANHPSRMVAMVDLGTQVDKIEGKKQRRASCVWELVAEKDENFPMDDRNYLVSIDLNVNIGNEKCKLRQWIEARVGKKFPPNTDYDITKELGQPCLLNITHHTTSAGRTYPKIIGLSAVPRGMTVPPAKRQPFLWCLDDAPSDGSEPQLPDWLPRLYGKKLADVIAECEEYKSEGPVAITAKDEDPDGYGDPNEIPF